MDGNKILDVECYMHIIQYYLKAYIHSVWKYNLSWISSTDYILPYWPRRRSFGSNPARVGHRELSPALIFTTRILYLLGWQNEKKNTIKPTRILAKHRRRGTTWSFHLKLYNNWTSLKQRLLEYKARIGPLCGVC